MTEVSPLVGAQEKFAAKVALRSLPVETCKLDLGLGRTLYRDVVAPLDMPPYPRAIVEGFLVRATDTQGAAEGTPVPFAIVGEIKPGDAQCPVPGQGQARQVATGSIVPDGPYAIVRMWEAQRAGQGFTITRPFPPRFFIEEQGCDLAKGARVLAAGTVLTPWHIGLIASLGLDSIEVVHQPRVTIYASGDEVIPYTEPMRPGVIRDSNSIMLAAAVSEAGGVPHLAGIMRDDFDTFVAKVKQALSNSDMIVISGGTAVGGRDFISDLVRAVGELIIDGVQMKSGRPLIMGVAQGKPLVCVAGHPPEALRGFKLFGVAALNRMLGREVALPEDQV